jgi:putative transposase
VFNSDQGSQFTSDVFTGVLKREDVAISMDGRGRALGQHLRRAFVAQVKYEDVYLKGYANMAELTIGLAQYFGFYNAERPHQALGYETPDHVYPACAGGCADRRQAGRCWPRARGRWQYGAAPSSCWGGNDHSLN